MTKSWKRAMQTAAIGASIIVSMRFVEVAFERGWVDSDSARHLFWPAMVFALAGATMAAFWHSPVEKAEQARTDALNAVDEARYVASREVDATLQELRSVVATKDAEIKLRSEVAPKDAEIKAVTHLRESAYEAYLVRLRREHKGTQIRAAFAFIPGIVLCGASVVGPYVAFSLADSHPEHWQYAFSGGAVAVILLAAGASLLNHHAKLQAQIQFAKQELLYFERARAALAFAKSVSDELHIKTLTALAELLITTIPPFLQAAAEAKADAPERLLIRGLDAAQSALSGKKEDKAS